MSEVEDLEKDALRGDVSAVAPIVRALRKYRDAVNKARRLTYGDGTLDGATASALFGECDDIEFELEEYTI